LYKSTCVADLRRMGRITRVGRSRARVQPRRPLGITAVWLLLMVLLLLMIVGLPAHAEALELLEVHRDGFGSVGGLGGAESMAMSPE
jgi:hypothetical protein